MLSRYALVAAALGLAAFLIWHPARRPIVAQAAATSQPPLELGGDSGDGSAGRLHHRRVRLDPGDGELVVYVAGAVKRPGLYHLRAGGLSAAADAGAVNLAQRANDGDEIYVPVAGKPLHGRSSERHGRRRPAHPTPTGAVDVNRSDAAELAAVPGIGRAIAARIVELREREGSFASLDELLDVAGMTQTRLERAHPYLRQP